MSAELLEQGISSMKISYEQGGDLASHDGYVRARQLLQPGNQSLDVVPCTSRATGSFPL